MKKIKKKITLFAMLSVLVLSSAGAFAGCQQTVNYDVLPEEGLYTYDFNEPFTAKPDSYMQLDGKFEEELWQNKNWLESSANNTDMKATTAFTSEGLYIGVEVFDTNITWIGRNNFAEVGNVKTNSFFMIQVIKAGQPTTNDRTKDVMLYMDCQSICSHRERKVAFGSQLVGEVNSGETTSLSGEIFIPWSEMGYVESEVNEYGYPENLQMNVRYLRVFEGASGNNFTVKSSPLQTYTFTSYPYYNENGLVGTYDCAEFGNAINGAPATDKWEIEKDENGKVTKLTTTVDRAQTIFFRQDSQGNATSKASDFILETRVKVLPLGVVPSGEKSEPVCGLWIGSYLVTGVCGKELYNGELKLQNSKSISDAQWMGEVQDYTIKNTVERSYDKDYVDLRIVKRGTEVYYFYNDVFYKVETREKFAGAIPVGLFANGRAEFTDFRFVDYSDNVNALTEYLSEYVYFVDIQKPSSKGLVSAETVAVKKGDSITLTVQSGIECYLSKFTVNGESRYDDLEAKIDSTTGEYVLTPTEDIAIKYTFQYFNASDLQNISILLHNSNDDSLANASYRLTGNNPLIYYTGRTNDRGYINIALPKSGVDIGSVVLDGTYGLYLEAEGCKPKKLAFELPTDNTTYQSTIKMERVGYATLTVNGLTTKDTTGAPLYDIENDVYYVNGDNVVQYFVDFVSTAENNYNYAVEAQINVSPVKEGGKLDDTTNGVTGIVISSGGEGSIVLKQTSYSWEQNRLALMVGDYEISIGGFNHSLGESGGTIQIKFVRYEDKIYVFDAEGDVAFYMDANGLQLVGERDVKGREPKEIKTDTTKILSGLNNLLKEFFKRGAENAIGMYNVNNVKAVWSNVTMTKDIDVSDYVKYQTYSGTVTGATENAKLELYAADGLLLETYEDIFDENGNYSFTTFEGSYAAIVLQEKNAAFIDNLGVNPNAAMASALTMTGATYAEKKASAEGEWSYDGSKKQHFVLNNMTTSAEYEYTFSIVSAAAGDLIGEAALEISVGEYRLFIGRTRSGGNNPLVLRFYKNNQEQSRFYNFIYSYNGTTGDSSFGSHFSSGLNQTYKVTRVGTEMLISMGTVTNGVASYKPMFKITASGLAFADDGLRIVSNHSFGDTNLTAICQALCTENATHSFGLTMETLTGWKLTAGKTEISKLEGNLTGATDGNAKVNLYDATGAFITSCTATVANGKYTAITDSATMTNAKKAIVMQGIKAGCIEDLTVSTNAELTVAYALNGVTYEQVKDSMDGSFGYTTTADTYTKLNNMTTSGDYVYYFELSASNPNNVNGEAGIVISSGNYSIRIERLRNTGASTISIYAFDSTKTDTQIHRAYGVTFSYDGNTNDYALGGHNSSGLWQKFKLVRTGTKIEIYMASNSTNNPTDYVLIFALEKGVGMTILNDKFSVTNNKTVNSDGMIEAVNAICAEGASNEFSLRTITLTDWQFSVGKA